MLQGVDLRLETGEQCALLGRSGSGKTTLLLVLAGLLRPGGGSVHHGLDARQVVYVPQAPSLIPELTAAQNATLGLRLRGIAPEEAQQRGQDALTLLGLDQQAGEALSAQLSGGMQQRAALARALAIEPRLLLADEPTGALDQHTGDLVMDALQAQCRRTGSTLVVATHDDQVAARFEHRIVLDALEPSTLVLDQSGIR
ncbi:ATP-binding cassette domain-containing protein [Nostocoides sp. Soil756]|uniref:ATP-binding cassette domain-containing protein n=1 Tax=Nostocoides sp. Soil756 TaxID=1736399 RepID=UPI00138F2C38|nr:ATP-binding cassette domain-containing protein [Tetrasphaera sp. Soil756]